MILKFTNKTCVTPWWRAPRKRFKIPKNKTTDPVPPEGDRPKTRQPAGKTTCLNIIIYKCNKLSTLYTFTSSRLTLMYPYRIRVEKPACQYHDCEKSLNSSLSSGLPELIKALVALGFLKPVIENQNSQFSRRSLDSWVLELREKERWKKRDLYRPANYLLLKIIQCTLLRVALNLKSQMLSAQ